METDTSLFSCSTDSTDADFECSVFLTDAAFVRSLFSTGAAFECLTDTDVCSLLDDRFSLLFSLFFLSFFDASLKSVDV